MLEELPGGYWENKAFRDPVLLVIQMCYPDGVTWGMLNGVLKEAMPGQAPAAACGCRAFFPSLISVAQNLCLLQHPQDCAFSTQQSPPGALPSVMEVWGADPALRNL